MSDAVHAAVDLRTLVEFNADGLLIVDAEGRVRFGNPAAARLFGRPVEELVGTDLGLPVLDGDAAEIDLGPRGGAPSTVELRAKPVQWDGTSAYVVTLRDVTERRRGEQLERDRIRAEAAREEAERATRRAEFLALASGVLNATLDVQTVLDQLAGLAVPAIAGGLALFTRHVERKVEAALPPQGIFVDVPGARLHVREQGRGPALLMIHGLGGHMSHFTYEVARRLAHHHRVITVDRPGSGYSTRHPGAPAGLRASAR